FGDVKNNIKLNTKEDCFLFYRKIIFGDQKIFFVIVFHHKFCDQNDHKVVMTPNFNIKINKTIVFSTINYLLDFILFIVTLKKRRI
ncbi:hypothetical protein BpHYR1_027085, partial [Brachionus plicatilis]